LRRRDAAAHDAGACLIEDAGTDFKLKDLGKRRLAMRGTAPLKAD
jgi:hypothetical protein